MIWPGWQKPHWATSWSSQARCMGCRSEPALAASPSIVVISSVGAIAETGTARGLKALPLMWQVHALQTATPQPYFGPVTPSRSAGSLSPDGSRSRPARRRRPCTRRERRCPARAGGHRPAPVADLRGLVQDGPRPVVLEERPAELVRVLARHLGQLVDDELLRLRHAEVAADGQLRRRRRDDLAQAAREVRRDAGVTLLVRDHVAQQVGRADPRGTQRVGAA